MKKKLMIAGGIILALVAILAFPVLFWLGPAMKSTIESIGSEMIGAPITIEKLRIYPVPGSLHLKHLTIGNPEGFSSENALTVKTIKVDIAMASLFSDTVVIRNILIDAPEFTYERTLRTDNITEIGKNIKDYNITRGDPKATEPNEKKVIIERLVIRQGRVITKISALPTTSVSLPDLERTDIGKNTGGTAWSSAIAEIISIIHGSIVNTVSDVGNTAGGILKDMGDSAVEAGKSLGDTAADAVKGIDDLFRKED